MLTEHRKVVPKSFISKMDPGRILTLIEQAILKISRHLDMQLMIFIHFQIYQILYGRL